MISLLHTTHLARAGRARGFTLLEVLVGLAILTTGLLTVLAIFPQTLRAQRDAELLTIAAALAQMKAEQVRRDSASNLGLIEQIQGLDQPTDPIRFDSEHRLSFSFCGRSLLYTAGDGNDPRLSVPGIARVIIRYSVGYRPTQEVIYELPFG